MEFDVCPDEDAAGAAAMAKLVEMVSDQDMRQDLDFPPITGWYGVPPTDEQIAAIFNKISFAEMFGEPSNAKPALSGFDVTASGDGRLGRFK